MEKGRVRDGKDEDKGWQIDPDCCERSHQDSVDFEVSQSISS